MTRQDCQDKDGWSRVTRRQVLGSGMAGLALSLSASPQWTLARQTGTPAAPSAPDIDIDALDQFTAAALERYGVPGAAVAVVYRGQTLLAKGYGVREIGSDAAVDADTVFQLASNTKPLTSFVAGMLIDEGLIGWDTPIIEVMPELRLWDDYATRELTLRDVLSHRSGLPEFTGDLFDSLGYDRNEVLHRLRYVQPGSSFREVAAYSNLNFFIAGEVIQRLTGERWEDVVRERLLEPLGMDRSGPSLSDLLADGNASANHARVDGTVEVIEPYDQAVLAAAGSAVSTANDMAIWMQTLLNEGAWNGQQFVESSTVGEMLAPSMVAEVTFTETPPIEENSGFAYGLGWGNFHYHGYEVNEKGGALAGVRTIVELVPQFGFGIAVLANLNLTLLPESVRAFALEQVLGASEVDIEAEIESRAAFLDQLLVPDPMPADPVGPSVPLDSFAGAYENDLYGRFDVIASDDSLRIEAGPADFPGNLIHFNYDTFLLDWGSATATPDETTFIIGSDGTAVAFEQDNLGRFDRVDAE